MTAEGGASQFKILGHAVPAEEYVRWAALEDLGFHFGQSGEDAILLRLFNNKTDGFYVDVGAFHPKKYSNTFILHSLLGWRGINIDASGETKAQFDRERPNDINVHCAVGVAEDQKTYYKFDHPARNTLSTESVERQKLKGDAVLTGEETIMVRPLADILKEHMPPKTEIDLLDIDIEGYDIEALESNDWTLYRPKVVLIEDYAILQGGLERSPIYGFMRQKGYRLVSHAFDTSIYIEKSYKPELGRRKNHGNAVISGVRRLGETIPGLNLRVKALLNRHQHNDTDQKTAQELADVQEALRRSEENLHALRAQHEALLQSRSWKMMSPVRKIGGVARVLRNGLRSGLQNNTPYPAIYRNPLSALKQTKPVLINSLKLEARRKGMDKLADTFVLYRIIGNDLYPRHQKGQSRQNLKFILEHEPELPACEKVFVVNRIVDKDEEREIIKLLKKHKKEYLQIPFVPEEYHRIGLDVANFPVGYFASQEFETSSAIERQRATVAAYRLKNNYIMNNNGARNVALADGRKRAKWVLPWDGNCYVTTEAWEQITRGVTAAPYFKYFVVPMARIADNNLLLLDGFKPNSTEEPQLLFRKDAKEMFNEDHPYGRRPKVELFWRLGIPGKWDDWVSKPWDRPRGERSVEAGQFGVAGWVARMSSGMPALEQDNSQSVVQRGVARNEAIIRTIRMIDAGTDEEKLFAEPTFYSMDTLDTEVETYRRGNDPRLNSVVRNLVSEADRASRRKLYTVVDKTTLPPSGDPHDYWSTAPYWWPNPDTPDGLPYIRKDGQWVPGSELFGPDSERYDRSRIQAVFTDSAILALAWKFTKDKKYSKHAADILKCFFVDPKTKMNPNLQFSQVRMGHNGNRGTQSGLIETKDIYFYIDAVRMLIEAKALDENTIKSFRDWLTDYLHWLLESDQGTKERLALNNHGTSYDLQVAAIAEFIGDRDVLFDTILRAQSRIGQQFAADGSQPEELARTNTLHYCCFNYQEWINIARIAKKWGHDLWSYEHESGASLRKGGEWLLGFVTKTWPYKQINPFDTARFSVIRFTMPQQFISGDLARNFPKSRYDVELVPGPRPGADPNPYNGIPPYWNIGMHEKW